MQPYASRRAGGAARDLKALHTTRRPLQGNTNRMYALLGACLVLAAHACEICQHKLFAGGCPVGRRKARERWGDWVVTEDPFDDGDCRNTCCAANEDSCCETDFHFVAGVAGGLFVLIAICVVVCCVECRRRRALGRVVRKRAAPPFEGERV